MTILIISTCSEKLSEREFVTPISKIVGAANQKILHYTECTEQNIFEFEKILICGTSLQDNSYQKDIDKFKIILTNFEKPILGICSGMQIVCTIFGDKIIKNLEIGMVDIETLEKNSLCKGKFQAYSIHNNSVGNLVYFTILAQSETSIQVIKHKTKDIFGVSFHPEVRNESIIENFLSI
jgi:GMP synthase (glutamine-hydrolysing)